MNFDTVIFKAEEGVLIKMMVKNDRVTDDISPFFNHDLYKNMTNSTLVLGNFKEKYFNEVARIEVKNQKQQKLILHKTDKIHRQINSILENIKNDEHGNTRRTK